MNTPANPGQRGRDRPLFGLRRVPGCLALALFRLPRQPGVHALTDGVPKVGETAGIR